MKHQRFQDYLTELTKGEQKHDLEYIKDILKALEIDPGGFNVIHIAGTNGKGSVSCFLDSIFRKEGKKTGLFISPHILRITERISVSGEEIEEEKLFSLSKRLLQVMGEGRPLPTYFEFLFILALMYFREMETDICIIEAGMGGLKDATNVLTGKKACIITSVGMDHMEYLGDTEGKIAFQKAGIAENGTPLFYRAPKDAAKVIEECILKVGASGHRLNDNMMEDIPGEGGQVDFLLSYGYHKIRLSLMGKPLYQKENASLAAMCALYLGASEEGVSEGIGEASVRGRMEEIYPDFFADGAHNPQAVKKLAETLNGPYKDKKKIIVFGASRDKDIKGMLKILKGIENTEGFIFTKGENPRMEDPDNLLRIAQELSIPACREQLKDIPLKVIPRLKDDADLMAAALGSFYILGELSEIMEEYDDQF